MTSIPSIPDCDGVERNGKSPPKKDTSGVRDEWVTIAEVAERLSIHLRQARRYADKLKDNERTMDGVRPMRVQWAAISKLRAIGHVNGQPMDNGRPMSNTDVTSSALVERLTSEVDYLRSELTAQRAARDVAEGELRRLMLADKAELVELRQRLAIAPAPEPDQKSSPEKRQWWKFWER